jgi:hypothetical protein
MSSVHRMASLSMTTASYVAGAYKSERRLLYRQERRRQDAVLGKKVRDQRRNEIDRFRVHIQGIARGLPQMISHVRVAIQPIYVS